MEAVVNIALLGLLLVTALAVVMLRDLFAVVMLYGIYSLLSAALFVSLDAVDVAFTEAAVGAGIATVLFVLTLMACKARATPVEPAAAASGAPRGLRLLPLAVVVTTGLVLVFGTLDMPHFGSAKAPAQGHVAPHYIDASAAEVGVPNKVTAVLASYRGYDTLGETAVIFCAGVGVLALLGGLGGRVEDGAEDVGSCRWQHYHHRCSDLVLRVVARMLAPFVMLFGLYVQFHGDYGPGGGFQAGVIFAVAFVLHGLLAGLPASYRLLSDGVTLGLMAAGLLLYGVVGLLGPLFGASYLDYSVLGATPLAGQHLGILLIELGVGITVFATMLTLFRAFAGRVENLGVNGRGQG